jgi:hypothetical protein
VIVIAITGCGKKGPPLPPIVRVPRPPSELTAARRGDTVTLQFSVPTANSDGSRPANVDHVDVYAFSGPDVKDEVLFKANPRIASVKVKAPKDPDLAVEEDEPAADMEPPEGAGLEQGATARVDEDLTPESSQPLKVRNSQKPQKGGASPVDDKSPHPLIGAPRALPSRTYVAVSVNKRGQRGPMTPRVQVPLVPAPPPPGQPAISYDEAGINLTWPPAQGVASIRGSAGTAEHAETPLLPSRLVGYVEPSIGYNVYELPPKPDPGAMPPPADAPKPAAKRLTDAPTENLHYEDARMTWGAERCYAVRTLERYGEMSIESAEAPAVCVTLVDTFPPAAPKGLQSVATEGIVSLIWQANTEKDLDGYIVLRGRTADDLAPITASPIHDTAYKDEVPSGSHFFYAVRAVDKAGNASKPSNIEEATAR